MDKKQPNMLFQRVKKENFFHCEKGATAIEYSLIVGGIAVTISLVVFAVGADLAAAFANIGNFLTVTP